VYAATSADNIVATMPILPFDPLTTLFTVGVLYLIMPLTVWTLLLGRHGQRSTSLWCGGAMLSGLTYLLYGLRPAVPDVVAQDVASAAAYLGLAMRWGALRLERGAAPYPGRALLLVLAASATFAVLDIAGPLPRQGANRLMLVAGSLLIAIEAGRLAREARSRSAGMIALTYIAFALALTLRALSVLAGIGAPADEGLGLDIALVLLMGLLSALWGNLGYLGFALETHERREATRHAELAAATARSAEAERRAAELKALSDERQELLRVIAHETRQPLHNTQVVLQGVAAALQGGAPPEEVSHGDRRQGDRRRDDAAIARAARARAVWQQITATLDNTLAASTLLVEDRAAPVLRDADLDMLLDLCLGDLPPLERDRVQVLRLTPVRTAAIDVGLMRLALRNLLNNALAYAPAGSTVTLRVADSDEPLALLFEVGDDGPGIDPTLQATLFERGTRGRHGLPGQGLGLYIVRRAMQRQGGSAELVPTPAGAVFRLTLPQGLEPA
jgi:signal transduction histidine kinase